MHTRRFIQKGDISTLNSSTLNRMEKFIYLGSSVLSTENDIEDVSRKGIGN